LRARSGFNLAAPLGFQVCVAARTEIRILSSLVASSRHHNLLPDRRRSRAVRLRLSMPYVFAAGNGAFLHFSKMEWLSCGSQQRPSQARKEKAASENAASMTRPGYRSEKELPLTRQANMPTLTIFAGVAVHQRANSDHGKRNAQNKKTDIHAHSPFMESIPRTNVITKASTRLASSFTLSSAQISVACHSHTAPRNAEADSV
jgi:hypothetical protein